MLSVSSDNSSQPTAAARRTDDDDDDEEWIAVRPFLANKCANSSSEIVNLVSISVEKEKILIVAREHSRLVTDDATNNEQWCGIFSPADLYRVHLQMALIEPSLDGLFPNQLRPIKGLLSTYFARPLPAPADRDLHDNHLCRDIIAYLHHAFTSLGKKLYIDILFNDISSDQYFQIYSEFNLNRLLARITELRAQLLPDSADAKAPAKSPLTKKPAIDDALASMLRQQSAQLAEEQRALVKEQLLVNAKHLLAGYSAADALLDSLLKVSLVVLKTLNPHNFRNKHFRKISFTNLATCYREKSKMYEKVVNNFVRWS